MFKLFPPDDQECGRVSDIAEELGGDSGEWPLSWTINQVVVDWGSPHHRLRSECGTRVWNIDAVAKIDMTAVFEEADKTRRTDEHYENSWLLVEGKWYWSPSEE